MTDVIVGPVTSIIASDTFKIAVTYYRDNNVREYSDNELIRIADIDISGLNAIETREAKKALKLKLIGRRVKCTVQKRDELGRIVAKIKIL